MTETKSLTAASWTAVAFAVLQSVCTAAVSLAGVQALVGAGSLAFAGSALAVADRFHVAAIRIPMLALATVGAVVSLYIVWRRRVLRSRPSAEWRRQALSPKKLRQENIQITLAVITLLLVAVECYVHYSVFHL